MGTLVTQRLSHHFDFGHWKTLHWREHITTYFINRTWHFETLLTIFTNINIFPTVETPETPWYHTDLTIKSNTGRHLQCFEQHALPEFDSAIDLQLKWFPDSETDYIPFHFTLVKSQICWYPWPSHRLTPHFQYVLFPWLLKSLILFNKNQSLRSLPRWPQVGGHIESELPGSLCWPWALGLSLGGTGYPGQGYPGRASRTTPSPVPTGSWPAGDPADIAWLRVTRLPLTFLGPTWGGRSPFHWRFVIYRKSDICSFKYL